jgi:hypothetical protein
MNCAYQVEVRNNTASIRAGLDLLSKQTYLREDGTVAEHKFDGVCWTIEHPKSLSKLFLFINGGIYRPEASRIPLDNNYKMLFLEDIGEL